MTIKRVLAALVVALALGAGGAALAEGEAPGGEGLSVADYGRPGMAGHLPTSGYAYNDGSR